MAMIESPGRTLTDLERKLSVVAELARESMIEEEWIEGLLADVRALNGRAV